jgi:SAM-dependent methyltransferase
LTLSAREHFDSLWREGDPWQTDTSEFERAKYARELEVLAGRRYRRALEIGCGTGSFTRLLATVADQVVAVDIAETAIRRARAITGEQSNVTFCAADVMELDLASGDRWDLVTLGDTISSIGWSHTFVQVACLAASLFTSTAPDGRVLVADVCGGVGGPEHRLWTIRTFRDLFLNVGFRIEREEVFEGVKEGVRIPILISLFHKAAPDAERLERKLWSRDW